MPILLIAEADLGTAASNGSFVRRGDLDPQTLAPFGWATAANGRNEPKPTNAAPGLNGR